MMRDSLKYGVSIDTVNIIIHIYIHTHVNIYIYKVNGIFSIFMFDTGGNMLSLFFKFKLPAHR
jgi:hypothetical protein